MIALLGYFFLQILQIIHADCGEMFVFVQSEQQNTTAVLVGKARQRVAQLVRTAAMRRLDFDRLRLGLLYDFCSSVLEFSVSFWLVAGFLVATISNALQKPGCGLMHNLVFLSSYQAEITCSYS